MPVTRFPLIEKRCKRASLWRPHILLALTPFLSTLSCHFADQIVDVENFTIRKLTK